jgi:hypothetical protein
MENDAILIIIGMLVIFTVWLHFKFNSVNTTIKLINYKPSLKNRQQLLKDLIKYKVELLFLVMSILVLIFVLLWMLLE